jgi:uncharacterized protein YutE (UPF0331/DUF86 family)
MDDLIFNKVAMIERCCARARHEYHRDPNTFAFDITRQDAAILNVQRACEAALDLGQHLVRRFRLGTPQGARGVFTLMADARLIDEPVADAMRRMVGFRNLAVHQYQQVELAVVVAIITIHLADFERLIQALLPLATSEHPPKPGDPVA